MLILKLALRGLWRHRARSLFTLIAVALGHMFLLVFMSMSDGGLADILELAIRQGSAGHVVVQADGYHRTAAVELLVPRGQEIRRSLARDLPEAKVVLRVFGGGLAASASDAVGIRFAGVEASREREVSELARHVVRGVYLGASSKAVDAASRDLKDPKGLWCAEKAPPLQGQRPRPIVVGVQLARTLKLGLCDKLRLDAQGLGDREQGQFRVVGMFETGNSDLDGFFAQIPLADAQRLLKLSGGVHQVAVIMPQADGSEALAQRIRKDLGDPSLEILSWREAIPEMAEFIWLKKASGFVFIVIVALIVAIGVLNTIFMSVMERTREFGVMRALGAGPGRILGLVLSEGAILGVLGVLMGLALGLPIVHYLATTGITYPEPAEAAGVTIQSVKARMIPSSLAWGSAFIFAVAAVAAVVPALRAARVSVLRAVNQL